MKESTRYPGLFVLKYKRNVFYDNLWDDTLVEMRGRVIDSEGNTVIAPFTKIFNLFENGTCIDRDEMVVAVDKINGFMAAMTYVPSIDEVVISTTGSLDSDFVDIAERHLGRLKPLIKNASLANNLNWTWLFEVVDETDPHIIKENPGAYLIGARQNDVEAYSTNESFESILDGAASYWGVYRPKWCTARFSDITEAMKTYDREGVVVYGLESGTSLKIKTPFYLVSKFLGRIRNEKLELLLNDKQRFIQTMKDEEFLPLIDFLIDNKDEFLSYGEQDRIAFVQKYLGLNDEYSNKIT
jgi:hypothetical protein